MACKIDEIADIIGPIVRQYGIERVYLFGSCARGEADEDSDVDLLIEIPGDAGFGLWDLSGLLRRLKTALDREVDLVTIDGLRRARSGFMDDVMRERLLIYDDRQKYQEAAAPFAILSLMSTTSSPRKSPGKPSAKTFLL